MQAVFKFMKPCLVYRLGRWFVLSLSSCLDQCEVVLQSPAYDVFCGFLGHFGVTKLHSAFLLDEVQKSLMQCQQIVEYPSLYFQSNDVFLYLH